MDKLKALLFFENSFLHDLLLNEEVTDISYNGESLYYVSNLYGRKKSTMRLEHQDAKDFLRQMANLCEKQFSYSSPNLDVTIGKYRLNALHQSLGRVNNEERVTFSIRIASTTPRIDKNSGFVDDKLFELLTTLINSRQSIVIAGATGSGKTEFQKFLISLMPDNTRVIVIDNVQELDSLRSNSAIDLTCWQADEKNINAQVNLLIKNALRSNPDWLLVAEARGAEMNEVMNSVMTGIPIITTLHAYNVFSIPKRITSMVMMNPIRVTGEEILENVYSHLHYFIFLKKKEEADGKIVRYISEIAEVNNNGEFNLIYQNNLKDIFYKPISASSLSLLSGYENSSLFKDTFVGDR